MYRHRVAAMVNDILTTLGLFLKRFLDMMWGAWGSIYWRKLVVFQWLDHREQGYDLGLSGWIELVGRGRWSFHESKVSSYYGADYGNEMLEYYGIFRA
jgi:hypothetical protein